MDFVVRTVENDDEAARWGRFCAARGFAHRPGPLDRFYHRLLADPTARLERTIIAVTQPDDRIVGSLRIFDRVMDVDGTAARMLGWGEVCSDPDFRGRGIAGAVLSRGIAMMDAEATATAAPMAPEAAAAEADACPGLTAAAAAAATAPPQLSLLHAAVAVRPMYAKFGYRSLNIDFYKLFLPAAAGIASPPPAAAASSAAAPSSAPASATAADKVYSAEGLQGVVFRRADLAAEWQALAALRPHSQAALGVCGGIARSSAYWQRWLPRVTSIEAGAGTGALWVAEREGHGVVAYAAVSGRQGEFKVVDCGFACGSGGSAGSDRHVSPQLLLALIARAAKATAAESSRRLSSSAAPGLAAAAAAAAAAAVGPEGGAASTTAAPEVEVDVLPFVLAPQPLAKWLSADANIHTELSPEHADTSWMVRPLPLEPDTPPATAALVSSLQAASAAGRFLIWGVDGF